MLGSGALIVIDDSINIVEATLRLISFYMHESWGSARLVVRERAGSIRLWNASCKTRGNWNILLSLKIFGNMAFKAFCPLADACVAPVVSSIKYFRSDYEEYFKNVPAGASR
ncbi:MAG: hypothetical protein Ct9H300mP23_02100 [Nitrospinota bacterium]|nr:MAG: hypothetical protein Ct9H300mP23_02100 [Nitrospinota bacterium]